ncbi:MAG: DUF748 domain-containing protein [Steroidobacteraceae bacterium]
MSEPTSTASGFRPGPWLRLHRRALIVIATLIALYALAGTLLLPRLLRNAATDYVDQQLHRKLSLGQVSFNPFTLTLNIRDASLSEADGTPVLGFGLLRVNLEMWGSLFHWACDFKEIHLEAPQVNAILAADGKLNLAQLAPPSTEAVPPATAAESSVPAIRIGSFTVQEGRASIEDRTRPKPFAATLAPITFALQDFRTAAGHQNAYQFSGTTLAGEKLAWSGEFTVQPLGSNGRFEIGGLKATTIASWLQDALPFQLPSGALDVAGEYKLALGGELGLTLELPTLNFRDVSIAPRAAAADALPWVKVPELSVANTRVSLGDHAVQIQQVSVRGASVVAQREADGSFNLQRLLGAPNPTAAAATSATAAPGAAAQATPPAAAAGADAAWRIAVQDVELSDASVDFTDQTTKPAAHLVLAPVSVSAQDYQSNAPAQALRVAAKVGIDKGSVGAEGTLQLEPLTADVKLRVDALDLRALQPYVAQNTSMTLRSGVLGTQLQIQYAAEAGKGAQKSVPQLRARGELQLANLSTRDTALNQDLLSWQALLVRGIDWQMAPDRWSIDQIRLRKPYARVAIAPNGSLNVKRALLAPGEVEAPPAAGAADEDSPQAQAAADAAVDAAAAPDSGATTQAARAEDAAAQNAAATAAGGKAAAKPPATPARIREILIEEGSANFSDYSLTPNFSTSVYSLKGRIAGLSSDPASRAQVQLDGSVDKYAPVSISGTLNLLSAVSYTDITLKFANMDLTTFNPYSGKFAGYNIERGKLTTELRYQLDDRKLNAQHHVVLDQLEFGAATESKDAVPLPIKLAVALLKDRNGVIDINLPVSGSIDDPKFRIAPIVWKAVRGLLRKIVTAPFALLGSLFGGGEELQYVDFTPGSSLLSTEQAAKLDKLSKALTERPQLKLDVPLGAADARDDAALAQSAFDAALAPVLAAATAKPAGGNADPAAVRLNALTTLYTTNTGAAPVWTDNLAAPEKSKILPPELIAARSDWLQQQLLAKYAPAAGERDALARARAEGVRTLLVEQGGIDAERIFLAARAPEGKPPENAVRMELKLQ